MRSSPYCKAARLNLKRLSLFGSAARGEATRRSDIDLAVTLDPATTPRGFYHIGRAKNCASALRLRSGSPSISFPNV